MFRKNSLRVLICLSTLLFGAGHASSSGFESKELSEEQVRRRVERFGLGVTARVRVRLRNGTEMEGFIDRAGEDHFYLVRMDAELGTAAVIAYRDVTRIEGTRTSVTWHKVIYRKSAGLVLSALRMLRSLRPGYRTDLSPAVKV